MVKLKDRRTGVKITRTVKLSDDFGDFYKFEIFDEGIVPGEETDSDEARDVRDELFKELHEEAITREAAAKAARDKNAIDKIVELLRGIFYNVNRKESDTPDPPVRYYSSYDLRDDGEHGGQ